MKKMNRIFHTWDKWECYPAGFYETTCPLGLNTEDCENLYVEVLSNPELFEDILSKLIVEWKNSCEHYLTNENMNRIAWMGQAAMAYYKNIPSCYRTGYNKLTNKQKETADKIALEYINKWLVANGYEPHTIETIKSKTKANIY